MKYIGAPWYCIATPALLNVMSYPLSAMSVILNNDWLSVLSEKMCAGMETPVAGRAMSVIPVDCARTPSGNCTVRGFSVGWTKSSAATASDSRMRVLFAPESAQMKGLEGGIKGALERILLVVLGLFCLSLDNVVLIVELILTEESIFLSWPTRHAFPPGGEELDVEFR